MKLFHWNGMAQCKQTNFCEYWYYMHWHLDLLEEIMLLNASINHGWWFFVGMCEQAHQIHLRDTVMIAANCKVRNLTARYKWPAISLLHPHTLDVQKQWSVVQWDLKMHRSFWFILCLWTVSFDGQMQFTNFNRNSSNALCIITIG